MGVGAGAGHDDQGIPEILRQTGEAVQGETTSGTPDSLRMVNLSP
ncbi:hypothetical protein [Rubrobacter marinus]|nr:hypothetical protein [Rubrobacter marinus]